MKTLFTKIVLIVAFLILTNSLFTQIVITFNTNWVSCFASCDGNIDIDVTGGTPPYTYLWSNGDTTQFTDSLCAGIYSVTVTDNIGSTQTDNADIFEPSELFTSFTDSTSILCYGDNNGSITVTPSGGTSGYNYLWDGGSTPIDSIATGLSAGTYNITVTDNNGCTSVNSITIAEPELLILNINTFSNATCGGTDGMATVTVTGGTPPYDYLWNDPLATTDSTVTNLGFGNYMVHVSDINGCNDSLSVYIDIQSGGTISVDYVNNVLCYGDNNGVIAVTISSGTPDFTFYWSTNDTLITSSYSDTLAHLDAGNYSVTVIDANGCMIDASVTITGPISPIIISVNSIFNATNGVCNGYIDANVIGGTPPFVYSWNTGENTGIIDNLCDGSYYLSVIDSNGCQIDTSFIIENIYVNQTTFVDTLNITIDTCIFNVLLPVDSAYIHSFNLIGLDSVMLNWVFWQAGDSITLNVSLSLSTIGSNLVYLEIVCNSKSNRALNIYKFYGVFNTDDLNIPKLENSIGAIIYPNPTTNKITITAKNINRIEVLDIHGRQVYTGKNNEIDLSQEPQGIYIIKITTDKQTITEKIIKQ